MRDLRTCVRTCHTYVSHVRVCLPFYCAQKILQSQTSCQIYGVPLTSAKQTALTHHERLQLILELHALHGVQPARATDAEEQTMFVLQLAEDLGER